MAVASRLSRVGSPDFYSEFESSFSTEFHDTCDIVSAIAIPQRNPRQLSSLSVSLERSFDQRLLMQ